MKKASVFQVMKVESSQEALQKIHSLSEMSEIMRQAGLKSTNLIFGTQSPDKILDKLSQKFFLWKVSITRFMYTVIFFRH